MQIKLFGKSLFEITKSTGEYFYNTAIDKLKKSDFLIDFYKDTGSSNEGSIPTTLSNYVVATTDSGHMVGFPKAEQPAENKKAEEEKVEITPKGVYELKTLHDESFVLKTGTEYLDDQIETFKEKLGMIKASEFDMNYGTTEIGSILMRLENRKKYEEFKEFFEEFPYTTTNKIKDLVKEHNHLKLGQVQQFLADMPKEAVDVMKKYNTNCTKICEKKAVFYIIANKKDFEKTQTRRDPILLAQSPFGHFWQILGAWDEEMILLEEL